MVVAGPAPRDTRRSGLIAERAQDPRAVCRVSSPSLTRRWPILYGSLVTPAHWTGRGQPLGKRIPEPLQHARGPARVLQHPPVAEAVKLDGPGVRSFGDFAEEFVVSAGRLSW